jgi:bis(5'-adenosyl)-triphosphatase
MSIMQQPNSQKLTNEVMFGTHLISSNQIFVLRKNVFAMVNYKPFAAGHVLVCSRRIVPKIQDLTEIEILDLFITAQEIVRKMEAIYKVSCQMVIQNGIEAGQTVKHAHMHIIPNSTRVEREDDDKR